MPPAYARGGVAAGGEEWAREVLNVCVGGRFYRLLEHVGSSFLKDSSSVGRERTE